jgi:hypothetical protein
MDGRRRQVHKKKSENIRHILTSHISLTGFTQYIFLNSEVLKGTLANFLKSSGGRPLLGTPEKASLTHDSNISIGIRAYVKQNSV